MPPMSAPITKFGDTRLVIVSVADKPALGANANDNGITLYRAPNAERDPVLDWKRNRKSDDFVYLKRTR
jgi:hypothetical protein